MAGGFSFPPPPPPPPKPATTSQPSDFDYSQQSGRGGRGRGGFESRGRGGAGRGRGGGQSNSNFEPLGSHQRPTFGQESGIARSGEVHDDSILGRNSQGGSRSTSTNMRPPPGSYINPNFTGRQQDTNSNGSHQPAERSFYGRGDSYGSRVSTDMRPSSNPQKDTSDDGLGRTQAGHKRKLDALRAPQQPREKKAGPQTAPAVPSFGAPILPTTSTPASARPTVISQRDRTTAQPKLVPRTLGLTPKDGTEPDVLSESEDEEIDEEAQFAELGTKLTFEHNGEVMTLNNEADLAAWKAERRKQFPTSDRVSQKENELLRIGEERKRLLAAVARLHQAPRNRKSEVKTRSLHQPAKGKEDAPGSSQLDACVEEIPEQKRSDVQPRIEEIPSQPDSSTAVNDEQTTHDDPMDAQNDGELADANAVVSREQALGLLKSEQQTHKALPGIAMDETDEESDAEAGAAAPDVEIEPAPDSASDDDDGPPEQVSSKPRPSAASDAPKAVCRYFSASGRCRDGETCRFRHELSSKAPSARPAQPQPERPAYDRYAPKLDPKTNDRKSIFERLVEQEEKGDDRLALQVIKALGQAGFFKESATEVDS